MGATIPQAKCGVHILEQCPDLGTSAFAAANASEFGTKPVFPDAKSSVVGRVHAGLLQGQQDLTAVMRLVRDEVPQHDEPWAVLDSLVPLKNPGEASLDRVRRSLHRFDQ